MKKLRTCLLLYFSLFTLVCLTGCALFSTSKTLPDEAALKERILQYYQAVIVKDWKRVYSFRHSSFKESISADAFAARPRNVEIKGYEIEDITLIPSGDAAHIKIKADIVARGYLFKGVPQKMYWVVQDNEWVEYTKNAASVEPPLKIE